MSSTLKTAAPALSAFKVHVGFEDEDEVSTFLMGTLPSVGQNCIFSRDLVCEVISITWKSLNGFTQAKEDFEACETMVPCVLLRKLNLSPVAKRQFASLPF